jgi:O-antigen/teichoic acid export membrane protein
MCLAAVSPLVAVMFREPRLTAITIALGLSFVLGGMTVQHQALLRRRLRFTTLAVIEIIPMSAGILTAIVMAHAGLGYWALVGMTLGGAAANLVAVLVALPWRPGGPRRGSGVVPMLKFGGDVLSFHVVNYFSRNADNLLIGWWWGATPLGLYEKAYTLLLLPVHQINAPLAAVAVPTLSRTRDDPARFRRYFLNCLQMLASVGVPTVLAIALFADQVVALWLGSQWQASATLFRLLSVAALLSALTNPMGWMLISAGFSRRYRQIGFLTAPVIVSAFVAGLPYGPEGVAVAYSAAMIVLTVPTWYWAVRGTGLALKDIGAVLWGPLCAGLAAIVLATVALRLTAWMSEMGSAGVGVVVFASIYAFVLLFAFRKWSFFVGLYRTLMAPETVLAKSPRV